MGLDSINSLLSSRMVVESPVARVGHHDQEPIQQPPQKATPTLASAPHLFDSIQKAATTYSVIVTASRSVSIKSLLHEDEHKRIMKRIGEEREKKEHLTLFPEILRTSAS